MNHGAHGEHRELGGTAHSELILDDLTGAIIDAGLKVHKALGPGLLEATYERRLEREFSLRGIAYKRQVILPIVYEYTLLESGYRLDMVVEVAVIIAIKAVETLTRLHSSQLLTYLKLSGYHVGFLMNFNVTLFKEGVKRLVVSRHDQSAFSVFSMRSVLSVIQPCLLPFPTTAFQMFC